MSYYEKPYIINMASLLSSQFISNVDITSSEYKFTVVMEIKRFSRPFFYQTIWFYQRYTN